MPTSNSWISISKVGLSKIDELIYRVLQRLRYVASGPGRRMDEARFQTIHDHDTVRLKIIQCLVEIIAYYRRQNPFGDWLLVTSD